MHLFYIDGSADHHYYTFSAIGVPETTWRDVYERTKAFRHKLRSRRGVAISKELHATKFLSGRGRPSDNRHLSRQSRVAVFNASLRLVASCAPLGVKVLNAAMSDQYRAFDRLVNRINNCMRTERSMALLICDEGNEGDFTKLYRRMAVFNAIPSKYGAWADGKSWANIPLDRVLTDPYFARSHHSNFIQLADFCAFALLRMDKPTATATQWGLDKSFRWLEPVCVKAANPADPFGVARN